MVDFVLALVLPFILMIIGIRVAYSIIGAFVVTLMILIFGLQFYEKSWIVILIAVLSLVAGWIYANKKKPKA